MRFVIDTNDPQEKIKQTIENIALELDIPELMNFSFLKKYKWSHISKLFRVNAWMYYMLELNPKEREAIGVRASALKALIKTARELGINHRNINLMHPELYRYIDRFYALGYGSILIKFKKDFINYAFRSEGYDKSRVTKVYSLSYPVIRRYLYNDGEILYPEVKK